MEEKKVSLFGRFHNQKHLDDYVNSISRDKQNKAEIYILLGIFEQTAIRGFKEDGYRVKEKIIDEKT